MPSILEDGVKKVAKRNRTLGNMLSPSLYTSYTTWLSDKGFYF